MDSNNDEDIDSMSTSAFIGIKSGNRISRDSLIHRFHAKLAIAGLVIVHMCSSITRHLDD
jgi:hypothetical protein